MTTRCVTSLSRLAIEALVHPNLRSEVIVQVNHTPLFKKLPGSVYLMMVLEVCHTSFTFKIDKATKSLDALYLANFPRENISKFSNETQRLIKILKGGYTFSCQLGSQILNKVCSIHRVCTLIGKSLIYCTRYWHWRRHVIHIMTLNNWKVSPSMTNMVPSVYVLLCARYIPIL